MLDRFVNGDPNNDDINGTYFEHDPRSNQMRHGGDIQGLINTLDYIQGVGFKVCDVLQPFQGRCSVFYRAYTSPDRPSSTCHGLTTGTRLWT